MERGNSYILSGVVCNTAVSPLSSGIPETCSSCPDGFSTFFVVGSWSSDLRSTIALGLRLWVRSIFSSWRTRYCELLL